MNLSVLGLSFFQAGQFVDTSSGLLIEKIEPDATDTLVDLTNLTFGFTPKTRIWLTFKKTQIRECESIFIDLIIDLLQRLSSDTIIGFLESDFALIHKQSGEVRINTRWPELISPQSYDLLKKKLPSLSAADLPNL